MNLDFVCLDYDGTSAGVVVVSGGHADRRARINVPPNPRFVRGDADALWAGGDRVVLVTSWDQSARCTVLESTDGGHTFADQTPPSSSRFLDCRCELDGTLLALEGWRAQRSTGLAARTDSVAVWVSTPAKKEWARYELPPGFRAEDAAPDTRGRVTIVGGQLLSDPAVPYAVPAIVTIVDGRVEASDPPLPLAEGSTGFAMARHLNRIYADVHPPVMWENSGGSWQELLLATSPTWSRVRLHAHMPHVVRERPGLISLYDLSGGRHRPINSSATEWKAEDLLPALRRAWPEMDPAAKPIVFDVDGNGADLIVGLQTNSPDGVVTCALLASANDGREFEMALPAGEFPFILRVALIRKGL